MPCLKDPWLRRLPHPGTVAQPLITVLHSSLSRLPTRASFSEVKRYTNCPKVYGIWMSLFGESGIRTALVWVLFALEELCTLTSAVSTGRDDIRTPTLLFLSAMIVTDVAFTFYYVTISCVSCWSTLAALAPEQSQNPAHQPLLQFPVSDDCILHSRHALKVHRRDDWTRTAWQAHRPGLFPAAHSFAIGPLQQFAWITFSYELHGTG